MEYTHNFEKAAEHAVAAVELMHKHRVPPHPNNFAIWFNYCADADPDLRKVLDDMIKAGRKFDQTSNSELVRRFISLEDSTGMLHEIARNLEAALSRIVNFVDGAGAGAREYGETLSKASEELANDGVANSQLGTIVQSILSATQKMEAHNQALEIQLKSTSDEVSQLRAEVETTRREASTDGLTGIANRKTFDSRILDAIAEATETGTPMCLAMMDIDYFKKFNDAHGHQIGDQVLILLARTLEESIKGKDTAARYGGEEFAVILPETGLQQAAMLADKIRIRLASKNIVNRKSGEYLGTITLSIGVAQFKSGESVTSLVSRADAAMYEAKKAGRNRVTSEKELRQSQLELGN